MRLTCPSCRRTLPARDVNMEQLVARCVECDEVFSVADQVHAGGRPPPRRRPELPAGITIERGEPPLPTGEGYREAAPTERTPGDLVVVRRWFEWSHVLMLFFCIAWDSFLVFWYGGIGTNGAPWLFWVFPIAHVGVGAWLTYRTLAGFLNRTRITVSNGTLSVRHGPLPWVGNREVPVATLRQLYVRRTFKRTKNSGYRALWAVHAETDEHVELKLLTGLESEEQARFIEWVVEDHLGIVDRPDQND